MKFKSNSFQSISKFLLLFVCTTMFLITGCQKEKVDGSTAIIETTQGQKSIQFLDIQKAILEYNFRIQTVGMDEAEIEILYETKMATIAKSEQEIMVDVFTQMMTKSSNTFSIGAGTRSTENTTTITADIPGDQFGNSVHINGAKVYIGAFAPEAIGGKVYEYKKIKKDNYILKNEIVANNATIDFGYAVSQSGRWLAVSDTETPPGQFDGAGKVYMFKKEGDAWVQKAVLEGPADDNRFGVQLALKGNQLAVMSENIGDLANGIFDESTISVFNRDGDNWNLSTTLSTPGHLAVDLDMRDGKIAAVGALQNSFLNAYISIYTGEKDSWEQELVTIAGVPPFDIIAIGRSVAIYKDKMVVSALSPGNKCWILSDDSGSWAVDQEITFPSYPGFNNQFVDMQYGGFALTVGTTDDTLPEILHIFKEEDNGSFTLDETLNPSDGGVNVRSGSISMDGDKIVVGCTSSSPDPVPGRVYVFE